MNRREEPATELSAFVAEAQPGPWRRETNIASSEEEHTVYLTNDAQDTLFVNADDVALLVNAAIEREARLPAPLDVEIERMAAEWPAWTFMFGHEVYDPIRGSPGELNHRELVGRMIWWATARTDDDLGNLVIKSAERQPSLGDALRELRSRLPLSAQPSTEGAA